MTISYVTTEEWVIVGPRGVLQGVAYALDEYEECDAFITLLEADPAAAAEFAVEEERHDLALQTYEEGVLEDALSLWAGPIGGVRQGNGWS